MENNKVSDKIQIKLLIGDHTYDFNIPREKEEIFRKAAVLINNKLNKYKTVYPYQGNEKYMSVSLLDFAVRVLQLENETSTQPYNTLLADLTKEIEDVLQEN